MLDIITNKLNDLKSDTISLKKEIALVKKSIKKTDLLLLETFNNIKCLEENLSYLKTKAKLVDFNEYQDIIVDVLVLKEKLILYGQEKSDYKNQLSVIEWDYKNKIKEIDELEKETKRYGKILKFKLPND